MKALFLLAFAVSATLVSSPAILTRKTVVPAPRVLIFQKKTANFLQCLR